MVMVRPGCRFFLPWCFFGLGRVLLWKALPWAPSPPLLQPLFPELPRLDFPDLDFSP